MKKKILGFVLAIVCILPLAIAFSGCDKNKNINLRIENFYAGEAKTEYEYGLYINDIISSDVQIFADFEDGTSKQLQPNEFTITYMKDGVTIPSIKIKPDVGTYTVQYNYKNSGTSLSFTVVPTNHSPYTINLAKQEWTYTDAFDGTLSLTNYDLKENETVNWYYIAKDKYDSLYNVGTINLTQLANSMDIINNDISQLPAGTYYVFGKINFTQTSNYTGITKIDENALVTVNKKALTINAEDIETADSEAFYTPSATKLSDIEIHYNLIRLETGNINFTVLLHLVWKNPETAISASDVGTAFEVSFEFANPDDASNYDITCEQTLTLQDVQNT